MDFLFGISSLLKQPLHIPTQARNIWEPGGCCHGGNACVLRANRKQRFNNMGTGGESVAFLSEERSPTCPAYFNA